MLNQRRSTTSRLGDLLDQAEAHLGLGDSYRAHAVISDAVRHYRQALKLAQQIDDRQFEVQAVARLAAIAIEKAPSSH